MTSILRNRFKLILLILSITSLFYSCEKGRCSYKSVGESFCEQGYDEWESVEIIKGDYHTHFRRNSPLIIRSQVEYDSLMSDYQPVEVDFDEYSLLGVELITGWGSSKSSICWLCRKKEPNDVKMYVKYSLADQCSGSGISSMYIAYWAKVPKLAEEAEVHFHVIDVNPYLD